MYFKLLLFYKVVWTLTKFKLPQYLTIWIGLNFKNNNSNNKFIYVSKTNNDTVSKKPVSKELIKRNIHCLKIVKKVEGEELEVKKSWLIIYDSVTQNFI